MNLKMCLRHVTVLSVLFALMAQGQAYAGNWFKKDPPPPPTWQDRVKQGWEKTCSLFKEDPPPPPTWQDRVKQGWEKTCSLFKEDPPPPTWQDKVKQGWDKSLSWCSDHKEEIAVGAAIVAAATIAYLNSDSKPTYTYEGDAKMGPGREFTRGQKASFLQQNREWYGGVLRSAQSGIELHPPQQYRRGVTPDPLEAQVDHIYPRSKGGWNTPENAQIISREENMRKSDHVESKSEFWKRFWNE